jgi:hypothetical protein
MTPDAERSAPHPGMMLRRSKRSVSSAALATDSFRREALDEAPRAAKSGG